MSINTVSSRYILLDGKELVGLVNADATIYLRHRDGSTYQLSGRKLVVLRREILAGRGSPEVAKLAAEYVGFLGRDGETWGFEALDEFFSDVG